MAISLALFFIVEPIFFKVILISFFIIMLFEEELIDIFNKLSEDRKIKNLALITFVIILGTTGLVSNVLLKVYLIFHSEIYEFEEILVAKLSESDVYISRDIPFFIQLIVIALLTFILSIYLLKVIRRILTRNLIRLFKGNILSETNIRVKDYFSILVFWFALIPTAIGAFLDINIYNESVKQFVWVIVIVGISYTIAFLDKFKYE